MLRACLDCGTPTTNTRCTPCYRAQQRARNQARPGHRYAHTLHRRQWAPLVAEGNINCARCGHPITGPWDIDQIHGTWYPSHSTCNRTAGGTTKQHTAP